MWCFRFTQIKDQIKYFNRINSILYNFLFSNYVHGECETVFGENFIRNSNRIGKKLLLTEKFYAVHSGLFVYSKYKYDGADLDRHVFNVSLIRNWRSNSLLLTEVDYSKKLSVLQTEFQALNSIRRYPSIGDSIPKLIPAGSRLTQRDVNVENLDTLNLLFKYRQEKINLYECIQYAPHLTEVERGLTYCLNHLLDYFNPYPRVPLYIHRYDLVGKDLILRASLETSSWVSMWVRYLDYVQPVVTSDRYRILYEMAEDARRPVRNMNQTIELHRGITSAKLFVNNLGNEFHILKKQLWRFCTPNCNYFINISNRWVTHYRFLVDEKLIPSSPYIANAVRSSFIQYTEFRAMSDTQKPFVFRYDVKILSYYTQSDYCNSLLNPKQPINDEKTFGRDFSSAKYISRFKHLHFISTKRPIIYKPDFRYISLGKNL